MAKRAITQQDYEKLTEAFLQKPGNFRYAAKLACVDPRTAKTAWEKGWPNKKMAPISVLLQSKNIEARAARQAAVDRAAEEHEAKLKKAREDAVKSEAQEAEMTGVMREWLLSHVKGALVPLTLVGIKQAQKLAQNQQAGTLVMTPDQASRFIGRVALMHRYAGETGRTVMEIERLRLGQPTHILGIVGEEMTEEQETEALVELLQEFQDGKPLADEVMAAVRKNAQDVH